MNPMKEIRIEKVTLNVGTGTDQNTLKRAMKLIKSITGTEPVKTKSKKRIPSWGLRPGLPIGCKLTLRGKKAEEVLINVLKARDDTLEESCFDNMGNVSFGVKENIDIPGQSYDPEVGIMGLQVVVTLERPGYRVKRRKYARRRLGNNHLIKKEESIKFFQDKFKINVVNQ